MILHPSLLGHVLSAHNNEILWLLTKARLNKYIGWFRSCCPGINSTQEHQTANNMVSSWPSFPVPAGRLVSLPLRGSRWHGSTSTSLLLGRAHTKCIILLSSCLLLYLQTLLMAFRSIRPSGPVPAATQQVRKSHASSQILSWQRAFARADEDVTQRKARGFCDCTDCLAHNPPRRPGSAPRKHNHIS